MTHPGLLKAWAAPEHCGARPWQAGGLARRQQAGPVPPPKRRCSRFRPGAIKRGRFPIKRLRFPIERGRFPIKHRRFQPGALGQLREIASAPPGELKLAEEAALLRYDYLLGMPLWSLTRS